MNLDLYLKLFPESIDSSLMVSDSTGIASDSTEIQIYSDSLYQILPLEKETITP